MSKPCRLALAASVAFVLTAPIPIGTAFAQGQPAAGDAAAEPQPKQVALTQKSLDGLIATQQEIRAIESKTPAKDQAKADPAMEAKIEATIKSHGFASTGDFADASYSVGMVLAGMDDDGKYVGAEAATRKQIEEVKADKQMPPKEKKEALEELNGTLKAVSSEKPMPGNIDLVKTNLAKLSEGLKQAD